VPLYRWPGRSSRSDMKSLIGYTAPIGDPDWRLHGAGDPLARPPQGRRSPLLHGQLFSWDRLGGGVGGALPGNPYRYSVRLADRPPDSEAVFARGTASRENVTVLERPVPAGSEGHKGKLIVAGRSTGIAAHVNYCAASGEVVPGVVEIEVAVPRSRPAVW
jgi:hypothetical protein